MIDHELNATSITKNQLIEWIVEKEMHIKEILCRPGDSAAAVIYSRVEINVLVQRCFSYYGWKIGT